jgi:hypothetical protein
MAYYVVYETMPDVADPAQPHKPVGGRRCVLLHRTHPVVWAARPVETINGDRFRNQILFWHEMPDEVLDHPDVLRAFKRSMGEWGLLE